jgi:hypothetical protein
MCSARRFRDFANASFRLMTVLAATCLHHRALHGAVPDFVAALPKGLTAHPACHKCITRSEQMKMCSQRFRQWVIASRSQRACAPYVKRTAIRIGFGLGRVIGSNVARHQKAALDSP